MKESDSSMTNEKEPKMSDVLDDAGRAARLKEIEEEVKTFSPEGLARYNDLLGRFMSAAELVALPDPPVMELLGPLLVRGDRVMLGAAKGHGKTSMMLQMIRAVLFGEEFLGFTGVGDARALILDAEQGQRTMKRRITEAGLAGVPRDIMDVLRVPEGLAFDKSSFDRRAIETRLARERYDIVVLDPFYMLHEGNSNDEREAVDLMKVLDGWRREYDFTLLLPAHTRKPSFERHHFSIDEFFGSSGLVRNAEVVLGLQKRRYGQANLHLFSDRDGDLWDLFKDERWGLHFDREFGFERGEVRDGRTEKSSKSREAVRQALIQRPRQDVYDIKRATGLGRGTVDRCLKDLNAVWETEGKRKLWSLGAAPAVAA